MAKKRVRREPVVEADSAEDFAEELDESLMSQTIPVTDNAAEVPLFADTDGRTTRSISQMRLTKLEPGGPPAYKGMIPLNSTLDTIGQLYGDGIYMIEGLNHQHKVLAVKENIRISLATQDQGTRQLELPSAGGSDPDRIERLARLSASESHENNKAFTQLVIETTQRAAEREAAFYNANREQMSQFFAAMLNQQQTMFGQTIALMQTGHNMTLENLNAAAKTKDKKPDNDSTKLVDMLLKGMRLGRDFSEDQPQREPWENILQSGFSLLAGAKQAETTQALPTPASAQAQQSVGLTLTRRQKQQLREALRLYKAVRRRGIDPNDVLAQLSLEAPPPPPPDEDDAEEEQEAVPQPGDDEDGAQDESDDDSDEEDEDEDAAFDEAAEESSNIFA